MTVAITNINGVILAGGLARRMDGQDKGLVQLQDKPLYQWVIERLQPQVCEIAINANRNLESYAQSGLKVFHDEIDGFQGALSGILTALKQAESQWVLFVPCDNPRLPLNLAEKLLSAIENTKTRQRLLGAYAHNGERAFPTCCLLSPLLAPALEEYLQSNERKMLNFLQDHSVEVDFSEQKNNFININTLADLEKINLD